MKYTPDRAFFFCLIAMVLLFITLAVVPGCSDQERARKFGGVSTIELPKGQKLVMVSWKEGSEFWYLVRPMRDEEQPETLSICGKQFLGLQIRPCYI